jgi:hypothetical protein
VVANQTLAEAELAEAIRDRQAAGPSSFYVLVPNTEADDLLAGRQFDEIILSTLPQRVSRWLSMDLPHRLHRHTGLAVTTITAKRVL